MTKKILTFFTNSGAPATGLSATIKIRNLTLVTVEINGSAMTEIGDGFYSFDFTTYDEDDDYSIRCDGSVTLGNSERYTYAGNESYVDDIWDAKISDHQVVGSLASEIRASHGTALGGGGQEITKAVADELAKMVWKVILEGDKTASEVLLSRSQFNSLVDEVIVGNFPEQKKEPIDFKPVIKEISLLSSNITKVIAVMSKRTDPTITVQIPQSLKDSIDKIGTDIQAVVPKVKECLSGFDEPIANLTGKVENLSGELSETNLDLSAAGELADAMEDLHSTVERLMLLSDKLNMGTENKKLIKGALLTMADMKYSMLKK